MKILIIKTSALGDIIHTFPAVQFLREVVPEAEIEWVVESRCASLVEDLYKLHVIDTKKWRKIFSYWKEVRAVIRALRKTTYDVVFDFQGNTKSGIITGLTKAKLKVGFGRKTVSEIPNLLFTDKQVDPVEGLNIRQDYLSLVEAWAGKKAPQGQLMSPGFKFSQIMVCPGSRWKNKQLPENVLVPFLQEIQMKTGCHFWILQGNPEERKLAESIQEQLVNTEVMDHLSLHELKQFMKRMDSIISMDSLPLHLAGEVGVPTFSLFGSSLAEKYRPLGEMHRSIQGECPYQRVFAKRCPILRTCPTGACMKMDASELAKEFLNYLEESLIHRAN